ncbi:PmoA family protein [bacterium]|nr:PmoA family protein [bacterium]
MFRIPGQHAQFALIVKTIACGVLIVGLSELCKAGQFELVETDAKIEIRDGGKPLLCYNKLSPSAPDGIDPVYERTGFLHPICSPSGKTVTASFPFDHPHQQGIFSAWVKTKYAGTDIDFWNLAKGTGRVMHQRVIETYSSKEGTGFVVDLLHRSEQQPNLDILTERWRVNAVPTDGTFHCFDLQTQQRALTELPLTVEEFHYGGVAIRGPVAWLTAKDSDSNTVKNTEPESTGFTNSFGSERVKGNHERPNWVTMWGSIGDERVSITVMCGRSSFRAPQATRLHPTKPYFCFCPCVNGSFIIDQQNSFQSSYRFLITDSKPKPEWVQQRWQEYSGS